MDWKREGEIFRREYVRLLKARTDPSKPVSFRNLAWDGKRWIRRIGATWVDAETGERA